jgi:hypothetical protein
MVSNGAFEPIYSFGHYSPGLKAAFLQIEISANGKSLEISPQHLIYTKRGAIAASRLRVGDELYDKDNSLVRVLSIATVRSRGVFAPFTPSGKLVVDNIVASSFISFNVPFPAWMAHSFEFPHRLVCLHFGSCPDEQYNDDGMSSWVAWALMPALKLSEQPALTRWMILPILLAAFSFFWLLEAVLIGNRWCVLGLVLIGAIYHLRKRSAK